MKSEAFLPVDSQNARGGVKWKYRFTAASRLDDGVSHSFDNG